MDGPICACHLQHSTAVRSRRTQTPAGETIRSRPRLGVQFGSKVSATQEHSEALKPSKHGLLALRATGTLGLGAGRSQVSNPVSPIPDVAGPDRTRRLSVPLRSVSVRVVIGGGEVVSIVAVVVTACGSVASARISGWREDRDRKRKDAEAAVQRREDLAMAAADAVKVALHAFGQRKASTDENVTRRGEAFDEKVLSVYLLATRVSIHFPRGHPATRAYEEAHAGLEELSRQVYEDGRPALDAAFGRKESDQVKDAVTRFQDEAQSARG